MHQDIEIAPCLRCNTDAGAIRKNGLCICCVGEELIERLDKIVEETPNVGETLLVGLHSFSEQRRLIASLTERSNPELIALRDDEARHPAVREVATHILEERWKAVFGAHGGEQ